MRAKSLKRAREDRDWPEIRAFVMERDEETCQYPKSILVRGFEGRFITPCGGPLDPHHIVPIARDKKLRLEPTNLKVLCRRHHDTVHLYPAEATILGLLKSASRPSGPPPSRP